MMIYVSALLLFGAVHAWAAYPPYLVIDGVAAAGSTVTANGSSVDAQQFTVGGLVVVLHGANGGQVGSGASLTAALNTPTATGTWDGALGASLSGHALAVPQVLVFYANSTSSANLLGYDGATHAPVCNTTVGGTAVQAYNGLPSGYIFKFNVESSCYRYVAGPAPTKIYTQNGWPASSVLTFPQTLNVGGTIMVSTAFNEGISQGSTSGYWCNTYYGASAGGKSADIHVFISSDSTVGNLWGNAGSVGFSTSLSQRQTMFTSQTNTGIILADPMNTPDYGPPNVCWNGVYLPYVFTSDGQADVYADLAGGSQVIIDSSGVVTASQPDGTTFTGNYQTATVPWFTNLSGIAAVSADGMSMLGLPDGVTLITNGSDPGSIGTDQYGSGQAWDNALPRPDGTSAYKYYSSLYLGSIFEFSNGGSMYGYAVADEVIDATNGWPSTYTISTPASPPAVVYAADGTEYDRTEYQYIWQQNAYYIDVAYIDPHDYTKMIYGDYGYDGFNHPWGSYPGGGTPATGPQFGPPQLTFYGVTLTFAYVDNGTDWYSGAGLVLGVDGSSIKTDSYNVIGSYDSNTHAITIYDPSYQNLAALDVNGELLGVPPGVEFYFNAASNVTSIQLGDGTTRDSSNTTIYTFTRNDGTHGVKYVGIPVNSVFIVQDQNGNYSSPVYLSHPVGADFSVDCTVNGNWPSSNLYPQSLYVNGAFAAWNQISTTSAGSGQSQSGSTSYNIGGVSSGGGYEGTLSISWNWSGSGFSASVTGSYRTYPPISGTWDGMFFSNLDSGLVITSSQPPAHPPTGYPTQITWNGIDLTFDPVASTVSGSNLGGLTVYHDSEGLGLEATIDGAGNVQFSAPGSSPYYGTYNPANGTFSFPGQNPGTTTSTGGQGGGGNTTPPSIGQSQVFNGNLSILGNFLTLGTWAPPTGGTANALAISYAEAQGFSSSLLRFAASHQATSWVWSEAAQDNTPPQVTMMELDATHRLILHDSTDEDAPGITLDPNDASKFKHAILVIPQGDLGMGIYTQGPRP